ncbi:lectin-like [Benincasa hispida]|uniref:lectin-like n=1 Tax=Benincasa hispida TaxID=102211 RepID=UPI0018FF71D3|nr:lectin-like [Benincasa hispida]
MSKSLMSRMKRVTPSLCPNTDNSQFSTTEWANIDIPAGVATDKIYTIEEAELLRVSWFDCFLDLSSSNFKPNTLYTVNIEVKLRDGCNGWDGSLIKKIVLPDGNVIKSEEILYGRPKNVWFNILIGKFKLDQSGLVRFQLSQYDTNWKSGIIIRALVVET